MLDSLQKLKFIFRNFFKDKYNRYFLILLVFFNILYLIFAFFFHDIYSETDGYIFSVYYNEIISSDFPPQNSNYWPPGLPVIIGVVSMLTNDYFLAGKIVIVEFAILFLFSVYLLIRKLFNNKIALFTFLILATNYYIIGAYYRINSDIPFAALIVLFIFFLTDNSITHRKSLFCSAIILGFAILIRWTGIFFLPIILLKIMIDTKNIRKSSITKKISKFFQNTLLSMCVFLLTILPYLFINTIWYGSPFYNDQIYNVYKAMHSGTSGASVEYSGELSWTWILFGPEKWIFFQSIISSFFIEFPIQFKTFLLSIFIAPIQDLLISNIILNILISLTLFFLVFLGYYLNFKEKNKNTSYNLFVPFLIIIYLFISSMGYSFMRFLFPIISLLVASIIFIIMKSIIYFLNLLRYMIFKFKKLKSKFSKLFRKERIAIYTSLIFSTIVIGQLFFTFNKVIIHNNTDRIEYKIVGEFLKDIIDSDEKILSRKRNYEYYLGKGDFIGLPDSSNVTIFLLGVKSYDYLIISERIEILYRPELEFLLDPFNEDIPMYLESIFLFNETGRRIIIYRIVQDN